MSQEERLRRVLGKLAFRLESLIRSKKLTQEDRHEIEAAIAMIEDALSG